MAMKLLLGWLFVLPDPFLGSGA